MTPSADRAWRWYLRACRTAQEGAARLQRTLVERLRARPPAPLLAPLTAVLIVAGVVGFSLILTAGFGGPSSAGAADPVALFKSPQEPTLWLCDEDGASCQGEGQGHLTINEEVSGIPDGVGLGSFEFLIYYSRQVVRISISEGPFLSSTGRETDCWTIALENSLRFGCVSMGGEPGPSGSGILAYVDVEPNPEFSLRPTARNGTSVRLLNSSLGAELADEMGEPIPIDVVGSAQIMVRALEGDLNYDCTVNVVDEQAVSGRYGTTFGIQPYSTFFDLEPVIPDFDIDIKDLQFVYGRDGTYCEGPLEPEFTPTPTSAAGTLTPTPQPATATPSPATPTAGADTATPTPLAGTPTPSTSATATPVPSPGTGTPSPSATPTPSGHRARTPTPAVGTPTPAVGTPTPQGSATPATLTPPATPIPQGGIVPTTTPVPGDEVAPGRLVPAETEGLPGSGTGTAASYDYLALLAVALAIGGWSALAGVQYRREGQFLEHPPVDEKRGRRSSRQSGC